MQKLFLQFIIEFRLNSVLRAYINENKAKSVTYGRGFSNAYKRNSDSNPAKEQHRKEPEMMIANRLTALLVLIVVGSISFARADSSERGKKFLLNEAPYLGFFFVMHQKEMKHMAEELIQRGDYKNDQEVFKERYGFNSGVDFYQDPSIWGWASSGKRLNGSCLLCHSTAVPQADGSRVSKIGGPNIFLNMETFLRDRFEVRKKKKLFQKPLAWYTAFFPMLYRQLGSMGMKADSGRGLISPWAGDAYFLEMRNKDFEYDVPLLLKGFFKPGDMKLFGVNPNVVTDIPA